MRRKILIALLVIAGSALLLYPAVQMFISANNQSEAIVRYEDGVLLYDEEQKQRELQRAEEYNRALTGTDVRDPFIPGSGSVIPDDYDEILNVDMGMMGTLEIPCIGVRLPVYHGVGEEILKKGVGHLKETAFPVGGEGNHTVLSTHRGLPEAKLFTDLDKVDLGDEFYIRIFDEVLAYRVDQIRVVEPENMEELRPVKGKDYVTLLTCTPYGVNSHRLLVRGVRTEFSAETAAEVKEQAIRRMIGPEQTALAGVVLFWLAVLAVGLRRRRRLWKKGKDAE